MAKRIAYTLGIISLVLLLPPRTAAQILGQTDTFQDGSLNLWSTGAPNPSPPVNISTGGPLGSSDRYLRATSIGGSGAGSRLIISNAQQWKGNYITAGIGNIHMFLENEGSTALQMRIAILSGSASCSSVNPIPVPAGRGWIEVNFPITSSALTGGTVSSILTNVTEIRLLHRSTPGTTGDPIVAQLGIDNITATGSPTNIDGSSSGTPGKFELSQNYPNPFNPSTMINYELPAAGFVTLKVYTVIGQEAATLIHGELEARGTHQIQFNASGLSSGIYFYRLESGPHAEVKRLLLIK